MKEQTKFLKEVADKLKGVEPYKERLQGMKDFLNSAIDDENMMQSSINQESENYHGSDDQDGYYLHEYNLMHYEIMLRIVNEYELILDVRYKEIDKKPKK